MVAGFRGRSDCTQVKVQRVAWDGVLGRSCYSHAKLQGLMFDILPSWLRSSAALEPRTVRSKHPGGVLKSLRALVKASRLGPIRLGCCEGT